MPLDDDAIVKLLAGSIDPLATGFDIAALYYPALKSANPPQPSQRIDFQDGDKTITVIMVGQSCGPD